MVSEYGWSNAASIFIFMYALAMLALSSFLSLPAIRLLGTHATLRLGIALVMTGFVVLIFAQTSSALAYIGILVMASGAFATPAFLTIISKLVPGDAQGLLQVRVCVCVCVLVCACVPSVVLPSVTRVPGRGGQY